MNILDKSYQFISKLCLESNKLKIKESLMLDMKNNKFLAGFYGFLTMTNLALIFNNYEYLNIGNLFCFSISLIITVAHVVSLYDQKDILNDIEKNIYDLNRYKLNEKAMNEIYFDKKSYECIIHEINILKLKIGDEKYNNILNKVSNNFNGNFESALFYFKLLNELNNDKNVNSENNIEILPSRVNKIERFKELTHKNINYQNKIKIKV